MHGRTALVTGASQGLGKTIALRFAREGATGRAGRPLARAPRRDRGGDRGRRRPARWPFRPTCANRPDSTRSRGASKTELGGIDALVAGSGIAGPTAELWKLTPEQWEETIRVNLTGTFLTCRALLPAMIRRGAGSIVVIGSTTGKRPLYGRTPYAASKLGLVGLVRTLAVELGPLGVRVNLISPGGVAGPRIETVIREQAAANGTTYDETYAQYARRDAARAPHPARGRRRRGSVPRLGRRRLDHRRGRERVRRPRDVLTTKETDVTEP